MRSFYKVPKCFKRPLKHLGYHFHHAMKPRVILLLLRKVTPLAWKSSRLDVTQVPAPLDVTGLSLGSMQDSSPAFPGGEQHCVRCHCTLGTQEEKTNRCKRSKRKSEHNRWCRSSLNGENKHCLLSNCLKNVPADISNAWSGECFFPLQYLCPVHVPLPTRAGHTAPFPMAWEHAPFSCLLPISSCWPFFLFPCLICLYSYFFQLVCELKRKISSFWQKTLYLLSQFSCYTVLMQVKAFPSTSSPVIHPPSSFLSPLSYGAESVKLQFLPFCLHWI